MFLQISFILQKANFFILPSLSIPPHFLSKKKKKRKRRSLKKKKKKEKRNKRKVKRGEKGRFFLLFLTPTPFSQKGKLKEKRKKKREEKKEKMEENTRVDKVREKKKTLSTKTVNKV